MQKFKKFEGTDLRNSPSLASTERFTRCFAASTKEERTLRRRLVLVELIVKLSKSCRAKEEREREKREEQKKKTEEREKREKGNKRQGGSVIEQKHEVLARERERVRKRSRRGKVREAITRNTSRLGANDVRQESRRSRVSRKRNSLVELAVRLPTLCRRCIDDCNRGGNNGHYTTPESSIGGWQGVV